MTLPAYPTYDWGKDEYREEVEYYRYEMTIVNKMNLTRKQRDCCKIITKTITESTSILKNSGKKLSKSEKQGLYELAVSRFRDFTSFFKEE